MACSVRLPVTTMTSGFSRVNAACTSSMGLTSAVAIPAASSRALSRTAGSTSVSVTRTFTCCAPWASRGGSRSRDPRWARAPRAQSATPDGEPGKFTMSERARTPAMPRDSAARGNLAITLARNDSAMPGASRSITARVASGRHVARRKACAARRKDEIRRIVIAPLHERRDDEIGAIGDERARRAVRNGARQPTDATASPERSARSPRAPASEMVRMATRMALLRTPVPVTGASRSYRTGASRRIPSRVCRGSRSRRLCLPCVRGGDVRRADRHAETRAHECRCAPRRSASPFTKTL